MLSKVIGTVQLCTLVPYTVKHGLKYKELGNGSFVWIQIWCMCLLINFSAVCCEKFGSQWHLFPSVQRNWRWNSSSIVSV